MVVSGKKEMDIRMVMGETSNRSRDNLSLKEVMDEHINELVFLEVEEERFAVRVKEIGLSESFDDINGNYRVKERNMVESI
ncbi:hypothetical protein J1N35_045643 [Gossypium stocksii]|uniref:Uncharacterized protein n=1 Tax=Gossypium stocksii TaxID=47602 RepID=A0A9D3ZGN3_9ROSI|nr:hypothetical protein J1N35_045643 [Gossypium stocksii]